MALVRDDELVERDPRRCSARRGRDMPANNLRQADVPEGATVIAQQPGTAPGLICPVGRQGDLRRARRALRDEGDGRAGRPPRPARAGPACRRSSAAARCARGASPSRASPSCWPTASTRSTSVGQPDARLPGQRHRGPQGPHHGQGATTTPRPSAARRRGGRAAGRCSATSCSASTTRRWRPSSVDLLRGAGPDAGGGRVGHRRPGRVAARPTCPGASDVVPGRRGRLRLAR